MSVLWLSSVLDIRSISFYPSPVMSQRGPLDLSKRSIPTTLREANSDGVHPCGRMKRRNLLSEFRRRMLTKLLAPLFFSNLI